MTLRTNGPRANGREESVALERVLEEHQGDAGRSENGPGDGAFSCLGSGGPRVYRMLRAPEVCERVALSVGHVYRLIGQNRFPRFRPLGGQIVGLPEHVLDAFIAERMGEREVLAPLGFRDPLPRWQFHVSKVPATCGLRLMRCREVEALTGLATSTFYPRIKMGLFPGQISLGQHAARWVAQEIETWVRYGPAA